MMQPVYISTTYLGPVQQYCKLFQYPEVHLETAENYLKQTFRNRCTIAAANGPLALSIPIVKPDTLKSSDQGHPYLRPWKLAAPTLERFGIGLQYESVFRVLCR